MVSDEKSTVTQIVMPPLGNVLLSLAVFKIFSLSLVCQSLAVMCLGMDFLGLTLFEISSASLIYRFVSSTELGEFLDILEVFFQLHPFLRSS